MQQAWGRKNACNILVAKPKEIYSLGDSRRRNLVEIITVDLKRDALAWTGFIWLKTVNWRSLVNAVNSSRFP